MRKGNHFVLAASLTACFLSSSVVQGQNPPTTQQAQGTVQGVKMTTPPVIDGVVDDSTEWAGVPKVSGGFDEETGTPIPEPTEYWAGYDSKYIYFAARAFDSSPGSIRSNEYRTNVSLSGDDFVGIFIDTFGNMSEASQFEVNPAGATNLKLAGGRAAKREWLGEIEAKGRITESGYEVEARIPWSLMRLPSPGIRNMRIGFYRGIARLSRAFLWPNISGGKINNVPFWTDIEVPAVDRSRVVKLLPYFYAGADERDGLIANSGLDLKTYLTEQMELVGSINPDFRNIENQVLSLDFSYFERLAGESRPFFLEGQQYFRTSGDAPLFASQRIRTFDIGAKVFGRLDKNTTLAVLDTVDFERNNAFVGQIRYDWDPRTSARFAATNLHQQGGPENTATFASYGRGFGSYEFFAQHMTTHDSERGDGHRYNTGIGYNAEGIGGFVEYVEVSPNFLPRLGFAPERDFRGFNADVDVERIHEKGLLAETGFSAGVHDYRRISGEPYRQGFEADGSLTLRDGTDIDFGFEFEKFLDNDDKVYFVDVERPRGNPYRNWHFNYEWGRVAGHDYSSFSPAIAYRPFQRLQLVGRYQVVRHEENERLLILSANYDLNRDESVSGRLIQRDGGTSFYLAFRRSGNKGNEYFLILGDPNSRSFRASVILKVVIPLNWKL